MRCGSLFSGVGGMDLGLARAGFVHEFFCESDPYRRRVLMRHWPGVPVYEDVAVVGRPQPASVRRVAHVASDEGRIRDVAPTVDLLCGGFPCQDLSVAGRRKGLAGERSGLFFEFARVADAVLPDGGWLLIENVPGLLSSNGGRDFAVVLATLAELGFHDLAWRVLDSRYFGVPQRRRRVFVLARRACGRRACEVLLEPEVGGGDFEAGRKAREGVADGSGGGVANPLGAKRPDQGGYRNDLDNDTYIAGPVTRRYGKGINTTIDDGAAVVAHTLRSEGFDASEDGTGRGTPLTVSSPTDPDGGAGMTPLRAGATGANQPVVGGEGGSGSSVRRLTPTQDRMREVAEPPGRLDGAFGPVARTLTSSERWDGETEDFVMDEPRAFMPYRTLEKDGSVSGGFAEREVVDALHGPTGNKEPLVTGGRQNSMMTPHDPKPDGPRYAACGDAVTSNVAQWIGRRILEADSS